MKTLHHCPTHGIIEFQDLVPHGSTYHCPSCSRVLHTEQVPTDQDWQHRALYAEAELREARRQLSMMRGA